MGHRVPGEEELPPVSATTAQLSNRPSIGLSGSSQKHGYNNGEENFMPLRDHFRPPISKRSSWEGFHGMWPGMIVLKLGSSLPPGYLAEPRVHLGAYYEIDVCTFEPIEDGEVFSHHSWESNVAQATAGQVVPAPTLTLDAEFPEEYSYEVLIFDVEHDRRLVAAIEIVSPANKDRAESRRLFAAKCLNLLKQGVCVSIIDLVTIRQFNLYAQMLALINRSDPDFSPKNPATYAVTCRKRDSKSGTKLDVWSSPIAVGQALPSLPVWLTDQLKVMLDLEVSYEETCRVLRIS
jgi:hypothetical protein